MAEIMKNAKIRCLRVNCNPQMRASGTKGTPIKEWAGNAEFVQHANDHPSHRIALTPVRSEEGMLKQQIRNRTGIYPTAEAMVELRAQRAAEMKEAEARRLAKIEWDTKKPERVAEAERQRLAGIERRKEAAARKQEELGRAKDARKVLVAEVIKGGWNLDDDFLQTSIENPQQGTGLFKAIAELEEYGQKLRRAGKEADFKAYCRLRREFLGDENWLKEVKRSTYEVEGYYTDAEMAERLTLIEQWEAMCQKGEDEGWLEWTNDYSGSYLTGVESNRHPSRKGLKLEDAGAYAARLEKRVQRILGRIIGEFRNIERARELLKNFESENS